MKNSDEKTMGSTGPLISFFVISFLMSWVIQVPRLLLDNGVSGIPAILGMISPVFTIGPMLAAFILTRREQGKGSIKALWKRAWDFSFERKWLVITMLVPVVTSGLTIGVIYLIGERVPWEYQSLPPALAVPIFLAIYLTQALPEEIGWRGFALDKLQTRTNAVIASLVLGFLWGLWHLPLHFMQGTTQAAIPVAEFIAKQMVGSIFYTWIYNNSKKNLFLMVLLHAVWNVFGGLIPYWVTASGRWVSFIVEVVIAGVIILFFGAKNLTKEK